ncbi:MAG: YihA family ribosome biogenesis GTP-binding protein [Oscillospiraceae bacterium]|nr:YihA family ribosome biogenesis GTP-binding protein [Oscillospiraceae bacterium]MBQ6404349.1 YihA family ribosome biogenesis GTP-binding protein [Oscillospiraceae bacterium]
MPALNLNNAEFIKSAANPNGFLRTDEPCIIFAGKSNVGKSSVINRVLNRKNFARVGAHPGKTIHVNYFHIDKKVYFVDLPGYGYASVAKTERERWGKMMEAFFSDPDRIDLGVMIVDSRHKPTKDDVTMADWFHSTGCPLVVVANKTDKLKKSEIEPNLKLIAETLSLDESAVLIPFSAEKGTGRELLLAELMKVVK